VSDSGGKKQDLRRHARSRWKMCLPGSLEKVLGLNLVSLHPQVATCGCARPVEGAGLVFVSPPAIGDVVSVSFHPQVATTRFCPSTRK
jgi:hypothetical protein